MQPGRRLVPYPPCPSWTSRHVFLPESGLCKRIAKVPAVTFILLSSLLSCLAGQCSIIGKRVVNFANANCEGSSASSCWTVISFELPEQLSRQNVTSAAMPLRDWRNVSEFRSHTLTVLHNGGRKGQRRGFDVWGEDGWDHQDEPGLHFSVDTRIIEVTEGSSVLQVQVLYGSSKDEMSKTTPGWMGSEPKIVFVGGQHLKLEAIFCPNAGASGIGAPASPLHVRDSDSRGSSFPSFLPKVKDPPMQSSASLHSGANLRHLVGQDKEASTANRGNLRGNPDLPSPGHAFVQAISGEGREFVSGRHARGGQGMSTGGGCEAFPDRDEWCNTALSRTQLEALRVRGAKLYCSAECASHGGLECHAFGRENCRLCSDDCDAFCEGVEDCACRRCSAAPRAPGTRKCSPGDDATCYRQLSPDASKALEEKGMGLECDPTCHFSSGDGWPLWCFAQEVVGCRYCARSCRHICGEGVPQCSDCYECGGGGHP